MSKLGKYKKKLDTYKHTKLESSKFEVPKSVHNIDCPILTEQVRLPNNPYRSLRYATSIEKRFINDKCNDLVTSIKLSITEDILKSPDFLLKIVSRLGKCTQDWIKDIIYANEEFNQNILKLNRERLRNKLELITWENAGDLLHNKEITLDEYIRYVECLYKYLTTLCISSFTYGEDSRNLYIEIDEDDIIAKISDDLENASEDFVWLADFLVNKFGKCHIETPSFVVSVENELPILSYNAISDDKELLGERLSNKIDDMVDSQGFNEKNAVSLYYRDYALVKDNHKKEILISGQVIRKGICESEEDATSYAKTVLQGIKELRLEREDIVHKEVACGQMLIYILNYHLKYLQEDISVSRPKIITANKLQKTNMFDEPVIDTKQKDNFTRNEAPSENILKLHINLANQTEIILSNDSLKLPKARSISELSDRNYYKERWIRRPYWRRLKNGKLHYSEMQICKRNPELIKNKKDTITPEIKLDI